MLKTIWTTGFYDGLFCFEILEALNDKNTDLSHWLPLDYLHPLWGIMAVNIFIDSIIKAMLHWWVREVILETKIVTDDSITYKPFITTELYNQNPELKEKFEKLLEHINWQDYRSNGKKYRVFLDIDKELIINHLNDCIPDWKNGKFFREMNWTNILLPEKQEQKVLDYINNLRNTGLDLNYFILELHTDLWQWLLSYISQSWGEPEYNFHPFLTLWHLQQKWIIRLIFWESGNNGRYLQYRVKYLGSPVSKFLETIIKYEQLAKKTLLKRTLLSELEAEVSKFDPNSVGDEILSLEIEKLRTTIPKTTWTAWAWRPWTNTSFVSALSENILEYKRIFEDFEERNWYKNSFEESHKNPEENKTQDQIWTDKPQWFFFDKNNWKVYLDWDLIDEVNKGTNEYKLIEILSDNRWIICEYEKIKSHINPWQVSDTESKYCQKIKGTLHQRIKKLIKAKWVGFLLDI